MAARTAKANNWSSITFHSDASILMQHVNNKQSLSLMSPLRAFLQVGSQ